MTLKLLVAIALTSTCSVVLAQKTTIVDPNSIQLSPRRHAELPASLLERIRNTTNVFEKIDGISYAQAVDLYKRDLNPEENLLLFEEMAKAYLAFCKERCKSAAEQKEVYRALLLRTMFEHREAVRRAEPRVLTVAEVEQVVKLYRLPARPIPVVKEK